MAQADVYRVAVLTVLPLEADQVTQSSGHAGPDRGGELPEQPSLEELRLARHRFEQKGCKVGVGAWDAVSKFPAIHLDDFGGAVGDGLLLLR